MIIILNRLANKRITIKYKEEAMVNIIGGNKVPSREEEREPKKDATRKPKIKAKRIFAPLTHGETAIIIELKTAANINLLKS